MLDLTSNIFRTHRLQTAGGEDDRAGRPVLAPPMIGLHLDQGKDRRAPPEKARCYYYLGGQVQTGKFLGGEFGWRVEGERSVKGGAALPAPAPAQKLWGGIQRLLTWSEYLDGCEP